MSGCVTNARSAFPAGYESEGSNDEWDFSSIKSPVFVEDLDAAVPQAEDDVSLLKRAISKGAVGTVEQLLDKGMDVDTKLGFGWTPLMYAVKVANYDLAKLLLDRGASANFNKGQWTVLMAATTAAESEDKIVHCVELLLSRNADPNVTDRSQMTCLMLAARDGCSRVINLLVSHGAEINAREGSGNTALSIAVQYGKEEAVLKLLQLGADKTIRNDAGKSPADVAALFKHTKISVILASSSGMSNVQPFTFTEETHSNAEPGLPTDSVTKLDELELLLHGLGLGHLIDIMAENDITWSYLLTMDKEDLEKIGITEPVELQKVLSALRQIDPDRGDLVTLGELGADGGREDLYNFLMSMKQQCCYLTETIQDVIDRFPCRPSELVFSLDPKGESQAVCNELVLQTKELHRGVVCLRNLLCEDTRDCRQTPPPDPHGNWKTQSVAVGALMAAAAAAAVVMLLSRTLGGKLDLRVFGR